VVEKSLHQIHLLSTRIRLGVYERGPLRGERRSKLAPLVEIIPKDFSRRELGDGNGAGGT
jgi:hypothetical protein